MDEHLQGVRAQVHAGGVGEVLEDVLEGPRRAEEVVHGAVQAALGAVRECEINLNILFPQK